MRHALMILALVLMPALTQASGLAVVITGDTFNTIQPCAT